MPPRHVAADADADAAAKAEAASSLPLLPQAREPREGTARVAANLLFSCLGNAFEWYDFAVFGFIATELSAEVFPSSDSTTGLIEAFSIYAVAFLCRPISGVVLGILGDKWGRKNTITLALVMMGVATLIAGATPSYRMIGIWSPIILCLSRMLQGLSVGAQTTGTVLLVLEKSPYNSHGALTAVLVVSQLSGFILGGLIPSVMRMMWSEQMMREWGWRVALWVGLIPCVITFLTHKDVEDEYTSRRGGTTRAQPNPTPTPHQGVPHPHQPDAGSSSSSAAHVPSLAHVSHVSSSFTTSNRNLTAAPPRAGGVPSVVAAEGGGAVSPPPEPEVAEVGAPQLKLDILGIMFAIGIYVGGALVFYLSTVWLPVYLTQFLGPVMGLAGTVAVAVFALILIPIAGVAIDYLDPYLVGMASRALNGLLALPLLLWLLQAPSLTRFGIAMAVMLPTLAFDFVSTTKILVPYFHAEGRYLSLALAQNAGVGLTGGTAPMVATFAMRYSSGPAILGGYVSIALLLAALSVLILRCRPRCFVPGAPGWASAASRVADAGGAKPRPPGGPSYSALLESC
mmetsp:Transcript_28709/g.55870  ORF Transcript_28709/g.55870 Transcript_28709/m.55870 type:complete len:569 (-) Transcript_28709:146-1852(-)